MENNYNYMRGNDHIKNKGGTILLIHTDFSEKEIKADDIVNRIKESLLTISSSKKII